MRQLMPGGSFKSLKLLKPVQKNIFFNLTIEKKIFVCMILAHQFKLKF